MTVIPADRFFLTAGFRFEAYTGRQIGDVSCREIVWSDAGRLSSVDERGLTLRRGGGPRELVGLLRLG